LLDSSGVVRPSPLPLELDLDVDVAEVEVDRRRGEPVLAQDLLHRRQADPFCRAVVANVCRKMCGLTSRTIPALAGTFREKGVPAGTPGRIAIPVAADSDEAKRVGMKLVDESGFDPFDAGSLADSWRQQPGQPAYCTGLGIEEMGPALAAADRTEAPKRRDLSLERIAAAGEPFSWEYVLELNRSLFR
jgi:hypothetical protein